MFAQSRFEGNGDSDLNTRLTDHALFRIELSEIGLDYEHEELIEEVFQVAQRGYEGLERSQHDPISNQPLRYFSHPRDACRILFNECSDELKALHQNTATLIINAILFHDLPEDTNSFGNINFHDLSWLKTVRQPENLPLFRDSVRRKIDRFCPWRNFPEDSPLDESLGTTVLGVTHFTEQELRELNGNRDGSLNKDIINQLNVALVRAAGSAAIIVKQADRLHNLKTMDNLPPEKIAKKIAETEKYYIPLFKSLAEAKSDPLAPISAKLLTLIKNEIVALRSQLNISTPPSET